MSFGRRLVYRLLIAVDVEKYSVRDASEQLRVQEDLRHVLDLAAAQSSLDRDLWHRQVRGDGELAVLPDQVDIPQVIGEFSAELDSALSELNQQRSSASPLRMRMALHHGTLAAGPFGPAGDAPVVVSRLLDAPPLRRQLAEQRDRGLALVISNPLYQDVVRTGFCSLDPAGFRPVRVVTKGMTYRGHIYQGDIHPGRGYRDRGWPDGAADSGSTPAGTAAHPAHVLAFPRAVS